MNLVLTLLLGTLFIPTKLNMLAMSVISSKYGPTEIDIYLFRKSEKQEKNQNMLLKFTIQMNFFLSNGLRQDKSSPYAIYH
jgi:hypothetical protein